MFGRERRLPPKRPAPLANIAREEARGKAHARHHVNMSTGRPRSHPQRARRRAFILPRQYSIVIPCRSPAAPGQLSPLPLTPCRDLVRREACARAWRPPSGGRLPAEEGDKDAIAPKSFVALRWRGEGEADHATSVCRRPEMARRVARRDRAKGDWRSPASRSAGEIPCDGALRRRHGASGAQALPLG
jgi:hypothetical protein